MKGIMMRLLVEAEDGGLLQGVSHLQRRKEEE